MSAVEQTTAPLPADNQAIESCSLRGAPDSPISIYEVHLPSWMRVPEEQNRPLTGFEIAPKLAEHLKFLRFTHVQLHSPDYSDTDELKFLVEYLQQRDLGVILPADPLHNHLTTSGPETLRVEGWYADGNVRISGHPYQWDFAWAEEISTYLALDPRERKFRQAQLGSRDHAPFPVHYILPLSDRLVSRPKRSLYAMMPGDVWRKFASLRLLFTYMYLLPGKKLLFMGNEFGQENPWRPETSLDWHLLNEPNFHSQLMSWVATLNQFYRGEGALYQTDSLASGFQWVDKSDAESGIVSFLRRNPDGSEVLLAVLNFTPLPHNNYRVGVPKGGFWTERLNSDALEYGGSGQGNLGGREAAPFGWNFQSQSLILTIPPLAAVVFKSPL